jgi:pyrroloquinoline quinone biosynthesis protein E
MSSAANTVSPPLGMLAELTHRCPLACPYCSNPLELDARNSELDTATWKRVFAEAAQMGVLQVHLSGGEPASRRDLEELTKEAHDRGLYTNLITSAVGVTPKRMQALADAGLDHVQISIQDSLPASADRIAGYEGAYRQKIALAREVTRLRLLLTVNAVIHRHNAARIPEMVQMAVDLGAQRIEIAHVQYYGWAIPNRAALMPGRKEAEAAVAKIEALRREYHGRIVIDAVTPDYFAKFPKACMGGWGKRSLNVTPSGRVLPCHAAESIPGLEFWNVRDHPLAEIWAHSPAFEAFRGTSWMKEPCVTCVHRERDFGGCRCQAFAVLGDARAADPVCHMSPHHNRMAELAEAGTGEEAFVYRGR